MATKQAIVSSNIQTDTSSELLSNISTTMTPSFTFDSFVTNFHFIRPAWLLAFFALFLVLFLLKRMRYYQSPWQRFLPSHLASALLENTNSFSTKSATSSSSFWLKPFIIGCCIIIALAGPAWQKIPQPVYQLDRGAVLIMDMSYSMYATDVKPNRLTRSRYKAIDLLKKINEGDVGLIAYAGDAFIISPLTEDIKNIELLLPSLSPDIMPVHGANAIAALTLANQTFKNSGHLSGDIYWFTDDIENEEMSDIYQWASENNHRVNILGVGTKEGAPIKLSNGQLLKDNSGSIVVPKLPESRLSAIASRSRGIYQTMTNSGSDIKALTSHLTNNINNEADESSVNGLVNEQKEKQAMQGDQYHEQGPWLLLIMVPLFLSYFRRGSSILAITWLFPSALMLTFMSVSPNSYAQAQAPSQVNTPVPPAPNTATSKMPTPGISKKTVPVTKQESSVISKVWKDLWQTSDQQGQQHYQQDKYSQAAEQFDDSQWKGSAHYKAGEFEQALNAFKESDTAQSLYNQGNSLAQLQKFDEAIDAYKKALAKDPNLTHAKENLEQLEAMKKEEEQSQKGEGEDNKDEQGDQQKSDQQSQDSQDSSDGEQQESDQKNQQESQEQSDSSQSEQQDAQSDQENKSAEQQSKEDKEKEKEAEQAQQSDENKQENGEEKTLAQQEADNKAQETQQKHQQLLNKVTDDPYLLLRNKMRLEYQKRRQESAPPGETKKW